MKALNRRFNSFNVSLWWCSAKRSYSKKKGTKIKKKQTNSCVLMSVSWLILVERFYSFINSLQIKKPWTLSINIHHRCVLTGILPIPVYLRPLNARGVFLGQVCGLLSPPSPSPLHHQHLRGGPSDAESSLPLCRSLGGALHVMEMDVHPHGCGPSSGKPDSWLLPGSGAAKPCRPQTFLWDGASSAVLP